MGLFPFASTVGTMSYSSMAEARPSGAHGSWRTETTGWWKSNCPCASPPRSSSLPPFGRSRFSH